MIDPVAGDIINTISTSAYLCYSLYMKSLFFWGCSVCLLLAPTAQALLTTKISAATSCTAPVNFVLVHGFNSSEDTWSRWVELLREDTSLPCVNLYTFSYETGFTLSQPSLDEIAAALRSELSTLSASGNALFLMAHSMGGLITKKALLQDTQQRQFLPQVKQIFFIASPHSGLRRPVSLVVGSKSSQVKEMRHSKLRKLRRQWNQARGSLSAVSCSAIVGTKDRLVPRYSAKGGFDDVLKLPKDHVTVKNPDSSESALYQKIKQALTSTQ
jgi:pimeloyl-ACP methyl ester carboxylesterase